MPVIALRTGLPDKATRYVEEFSSSYMRMSTEIRFMKRIVEDENIENSDKLAMMLGFVKVSAQMLDIWAKYAVALSNSKGGSKRMPPDGALADHDSPPPSHHDSNEGTEHGN